MGKGILAIGIYRKIVVIHSVLSKLKAIGNEDKMDVLNVLDEHQSYLDKQFFIDTAAKVFRSIFSSLFILMLYQEVEKVMRLYY